MSRINALSAGLSLAGLIVSLASTRAEIVDSSPTGFHVHLAITIDSPPKQVYDHLVDDIAKWWESSHTFSGDAKNLYLEDEPKGWFGEKLPDDGCVRHMEVLFALRGKYLRLRGELGPLQEFAVVGTMTWKLEPAGNGTQLEVDYLVGGYRPGGLDSFAQPVGKVLNTQVQRFKTFVETGTPE